THSPEVVVASDPEQLFMLSLTHERTEAKKICRNDIQEMRFMLEDLGSRFSDVFGTDGVIWVEGPTERECFPRLLIAAGKELPPGWIIAQLRATGHLEGRHAKAYAEIYKNLSSAGSVLPTFIAISLDGDKEHDAKLTILEDVFGKVIRFLPRSTYENYL